MLYSEGIPYGEGNQHWFLLRKTKTKQLYGNTLQIYSHSVGGREKFVFLVAELRILKSSSFLGLEECHHSGK